MPSPQQRIDERESNGQRESRAANRFAGHGRVLRPPRCGILAAQRKALRGVRRVLRQCLERPARRAAVLPDPRSGNGSGPGIRRTAPARPSAHVTFERTRCATFAASSAPLDTGQGTARIFAPQSARPTAPAEASCRPRQRPNPLNGRRRERRPHRNRRPERCVVRPP